MFHHSFSGGYKTTLCSHLVIRDGILFHCGENVQLGSSSTEVSLAWLFLTGWDGYCSQNHTSTVRGTQRNTIPLIHSQTIPWIDTKTRRRKWLWITEGFSGDGKRPEDCWKDFPPLWCTVPVTQSTQVSSWPCSPPISQTDTWKVEATTLSLSVPLLSLLSAHATRCIINLQTSLAQVWAASITLTYVKALAKPFITKTTTPVPKLLSTLLSKPWIGNYSQEGCPFLLFLPQMKHLLLLYALFNPDTIQNRNIGRESYCSTASSFFPETNKMKSSKVSCFWSQPSGQFTRRHMFVHFYFIQPFFFLPSKQSSEDHTVCSIYIFFSPSRAHSKVLPQIFFLLCVAFPL